MYRIGAHLIDPEAYETREEGVSVPVEPQVLELLVFLIENRQRAVSKDEIIERIWKGRIVSDATLSSRIKAARQALGDDGSAQRLIRTIHGRGFRFVGEVVETLPPSVVMNIGQQESGRAKAEEGHAPPASPLKQAISLLSTLGRAPMPTRPNRWVPIAAACVAIVGSVYLVNHLRGRAFPRFHLGHLL